MNRFRCEGLLNETDLLFHWHLPARDCLTQYSNSIVSKPCGPLCYTTPQHGFPGTSKSFSPANRSLVSHCDLSPDAGCSGMVGSARQQNCPVGCGTRRTAARASSYLRRQYWRRVAAVLLHSGGRTQSPGTARSYWWTLDKLAASDHRFSHCSSVLGALDGNSALYLVFDRAAKRTAWAT